MASSERPGRRRVPPALKIFGYLAIGLALGVLWPRNPIVLWIAQSGTWFPRTVVTFATAIIFILMSAALAKTLLTHTRSGRFLLVVVGLYVLMGGVSLLYVSAWIPVLTGLPLSQPGQALPGFTGWLNGSWTRSRRCSPSNRSCRCWSQGPSAAHWLDRSGACIQPRERSSEVPTGSCAASR